MRSGENSGSGENRGSGNPLLRDSGAPCFLLAAPVQITSRDCVAFPDALFLDPPESLKRQAAFSFCFSLKEMVVKRWSEGREHKS